LSSCCLGAALACALDPERLREQFAVIAMVEAEAARILCRSGTDEQIRNLRVIHDALKSAYVYDPARYYLSNEQFHRAVWFRAITRRSPTSMRAHHPSPSGTPLRAHHASEVNLEFAHDHDEIIEAIERRCRGGGATHGGAPGWCCGSCAGVAQGSGQGRA
jgi:DNA-binding GntR family transcriptional regulator